MTTPILTVEDLQVEFATHGGVVNAVRGVSFELNQGEILAVVGESGCGKSVTLQTLLKLIPMPPGRITSGRADFHGKDLVAMKDSDLESVRGKEISMIFQDPLTSLNPTMTVGAQIAEGLIKHRGIKGADVEKEVIRVLKQVQIPEAHKRLGQFPHEFSGGMRQRIMIAIALCCHPKVLIADEPTTALDVTIQGQILALLGQLQREIGMSIILVTHDLGVVADIADKVVVMYAGKVVEVGSVEDVFANPSHPYTKALKNAVPHPDKPDMELVPIPGSPPDLFSPPRGCAFYKRCPAALQACRDHQPPQFSVGKNSNAKAHQASCWLHHPEIDPEVRRYLDE